MSYTTWGRWRETSTFPDDIMIHVTDTDMKEWTERLRTWTPEEAFMAVYVCRDDKDTIQLGLMPTLPSGIQRGEVLK